MRTERQMMDLILHIAQRDDNVRGVILNGSRTDPAAARDCFQDYDVIYLVTDVRPYRDMQWTKQFGEMLILQDPDGTTQFEKAPDAAYRQTYLMQFADGNRIDMSLIQKERWESCCFDDALTVILLDKDDFLPRLPEPDDRTHWIKRPSAQDFFSVQNEFWWVACYVAKGLWRSLRPGQEGNLLYAVWHMEHCCLEELQHMLDWRIGAAHNFSVSAGKCGKNYGKYLSTEQLERFLALRRMDSREAVWNSLLDTALFFGETGRAVGQALNLFYDEKQEARVLAHLRYVKELSPDAEELYPGIQK